jgi:hypothetical protein
VKGASLWYALILLGTFGVGWKGLKGTNTLAYYENSQITVVKYFMTFGLGNVCFFSFYEAKNKINVNNSSTLEAREEIKSDFESFESLFL